MYHLLTDTAPGYLSSPLPSRPTAPLYLFETLFFTRRHHTCDWPFSCMCRPL
jgi:hypothetical protein